MALMEIRMLISVLVMNYKSWNGVPDKSGQWDEEMKPFNSITACPRNGKCVVKFHRRD